MLILQDRRIGRCSACGQWYQVTKDGLIRKHSLAAGWDNYGHVSRRKVCDGSGIAPRAGTKGRT